MIVTPFKASDLLLLTEPRSDTGLLPLLRDAEYAAKLERAGNAFSAWIPEEGYVGSAGIGMREDGYPEAWMMVNRLVDSHKLSFHRIVKRTIARLQQENGWRMILSSANGHDLRARLWLERLGFKPTQTFIIRGLSDPYMRYVKEY